MRRVLCVILALALVLDGCALIFRGSEQDVTVNADQPDAKIWVDGQGITPGKVLHLKRGQEHIVTAQLAGYKNYRSTIRTVTSGGITFFYTGFVYVGAVLIVGLPLLIPWVIDGATGALNELDPENLTITMTPEDPPTAPPPPTQTQTPQWPPSTEKPVAEMKCPYCGQTVKTTDKECPFCGVALPSK
jgi:hypothetical protein